MRRQNSADDVSAGGRCVAGKLVKNVSPRSITLVIWHTTCAKILRT